MKAKLFLEMKASLKALWFSFFKKTILFEKRVFRTEIKVVSRNAFASLALATIQLFAGADR